MSSDAEAQQPQPEETNNLSSSSSAGNAKIISTLVVAVIALIVGSVALSRTSSSNSSPNTKQHQQQHEGVDDKDDLTATSSTAPNPSGTLSAVSSSGILKCGIIPVTGFADNSSGTWEGMDADLCRAVAGGIGAEVEFVATTFTSRWEDLKSGQIDLLSAYSTHTMERDVHQSSVGEGFCWSAPYFYDGATCKFDLCCFAIFTYCIYLQSLLTHQSPTLDAGIPDAVACLDKQSPRLSSPVLVNFTTNNSTDSGDDCSNNIKLCVQSGSTTITAANKVLPKENIIGSPTLQSVFDNFISGKCTAIAGGRAEVAPTSAKKSGYDGAYEVGAKLWLRDPLAMAGRDDDQRWCDVIFWTQQALFAAEERNLTQSTASEMSPTSVFGEKFQDFFVNVVKAVGSYAEVYARNVEAIIPRGGFDIINTGESGILHSMPFGDLSVEGDNPLANPESTISKIHKRGHLRCGITRRASFAEFNSETLEFEGYDVDFCKAISAAIFDGPVDNIVYVDLPASSRFQYLQDGSVDVLSRITTHTLERDVKEPTTGQGFTFTVPNYYDGLHFGGIPPYGQCADNLDTQSAECKGVKICVNEGTTTEAGVRGLFGDQFIFPMSGGEASLRGLVTGECNVVAGGNHDVAIGSVQSVGYDGPYEIGVKTHSKDPLAIVTREDDPSFSDFCYWVVQATIFAEEEGITQSTAGSKMPLTNLFGELFRRMLQNAVQAAGNTGELYSRNVERLIPRAGLNQLNTGGPQMYSLPGI